jgi:hypothetical protein
MPGISQSPYEVGAQMTSLIQDLCDDPEGQLFTPLYIIEAVNSATRWIGRELRNRGKMTLVEDAFDVVIPGVVTVDPTQRVNLGFTGISGNVIASNDIILPNDLIEPLVLHERPNGMNVVPAEMRDSTGKGGLPYRFQRMRLGEWEWRQDEIIFVGATQDTQVIIRYSAIPLQFSLSPDPPQVITGTFSDIDCMDAAAYYAASQLLPKHGGAPLGAQYRKEADVLLEQLATDVTRQQQFSPTRMRPYGNTRGRTGSRFL